MNLNIKDWKEFRFGNLISDIYKAKPIHKNNLIEATDLNYTIRYITRTGENNGCELLADIREIDPKIIEKANAISIGDTTATCFYQDENFITGDHMVIVRADDWLNSNTALYILTILNNEQFKYSYGRAFLMDRIKDTIINLPIKYNSDGTPFIDKTKKYSNEGYVPDYQFMENYIKSLHHKPLTTKNKPGRAPALDVQGWGEFYLRDLFPDICNCVSHDLGNLENGTVAFIGRTAENNGLQGFVDVSEKDINDGECISLSRVASNVALWQPTPFTTSQHITTFRCAELNIYRGMFICTVMNKYMDGRFSYGRTIGEKDITDFTIKLPVDANGNPDWSFMEDYIKSLPYGDRLNG